MEQVASIEELLTEILVRVPARPLVRFKCVSKHWLSLISDPEFCHRHTLQNPNASVSAVFPCTSTSITALSFIPLGDFDHHPKSNYADQTLSGSPNSSNPRNFVPNLHRIMFLQSCSGLFLCCPLPFEKIRRYYILNPTTNQFSTLTPPAAAAATSVGYQFRILSEALAFDPSRSPHYNVVVFWTNNNYGLSNINFRIELYSSETKTWRLVDSSFSLPFYFRYDGAVYCNGAVHWIGVRTPLSYYHIDSERVGYVNEIDIDIGAFGRRFRFLQESHCGGSFLYLIDIYVSRIEVSEVERDYSGWCLKYRIDTDRILTTRKFAVLFLTPEEVEGDESSSLLLHTPGKVISYNLKCKTSKSFRLTPRQGIDDSNLRVGHQNIRYMETLACV